MKKKIKDLTLSEVEEICKTHTCDDCPLWNPRNEDVCLFCDFKHWLGFMNENEVEVKRRTDNAKKKQIN